MRNRVILASVIILLLVGFGLVVQRHGVFRKRSSAEWQGLETASAVTHAISTGNGSDLLKHIQPPASMTRYTDAEQSEFLLKALRDEITPDGVALLRREAKFGSLSDIFPEEGAKWAEQAGVRVSDCVAFRLDRSGPRLELVLATNVTPHRIIRVDNVTTLKNAGVE